MDSGDDGKLRDSEVALMDALKVVFDLMLTAGVKPAQVDKLLASLSYPAEMPRAVFVIEHLREFVNRPEREAHRQQVRQVREEPPAGSA